MKKQTVWSVCILTLEPRTCQGIVARLATTLHCAHMTDAKKKPRRSQSERREAMRKRILEATLHCLAKYGYAGTSLSRVVARAHVSRGAWAHHFPSMQALIHDAAEYLMARVYERLGAVLRNLSEGGDGLRGPIHTAWREFFSTEGNEIYLELLVARRPAPKLPAMLRSMSKSL